MKSSRWFLAVGFFIYSIQGFAIEAKKFKSTDKFPKALNVSDYSKPNKLQKLSKMQWYIHKSQWRKCVEVAEGATQNTSLGVWVPVNHLWCLNKVYATPTKWTVSRLLQSFKKIEGNKNKILNSPFNGHKEKLLNVFLDLAKLASEKARNQFDGFVDRNHDLVDHMNDRQRAKYYRIMGEIAWLRQKNDIASANFLRSYSFEVNSQVLKRLKSLKADEPLKLNKYTKDFNESDEENKLWGKFASANSRGQTYKIAQYGAEFLNKFPGSKRSKDVQEKINTVYKRLLYRRGNKFVSIKRDFEGQLMKAPPQNILYWGTEAYERGYQESSFRLADKAADKWEDTPQAAEALIVAARSAYYLGKRSSAKSYLNTLIEKYSGHEASFEAHYLLGLLHFREKEYKKVINIYDSFLLSSGSDKWELQVRYWLWRALKKIESNRSNEIAESIFKNFPLTYYGLIVRMEEKKGLQNLLTEKALTGETSYWWTNHTRSRWARIKKLIELGWLDEAETEIDFMPDPQTADGFLVRAKLWEAALRPNRAIQDYASAIDRNLANINRPLLMESFPRKYEKGVLAAEKEFNVSQNLIWAIMRQESAFVPRAISPSNAYGLMQLLSGTANETAKWLRDKKFRMPEGIFNTNTNIRFGTHFLSRMIGKYKNVIPLAVASYNVGPGNLDRWLSHRDDLKDWDKIGASPDDDIWVDELPWAETSFYVKAVMRNYLLYKLIHEKYDTLASPAWKEAKLK